MRVFIPLFVLLILAGCGTGDMTGRAIMAAGSADLVEVYHFHGTAQCVSCVMVGDLAEKTLTTRFADELESGQIVFAHVNGELPENRELVTRFGATGSSLWIGTTINGTFVPEQNIIVWYRINNEAGYQDYLSGVIEKRLSGDLS